jgi:hypothetical protein
MPSACAVQRYATSTRAFSGREEVGRYAARILWTPVRQSKTTVWSMES